MLSKRLSFLETRRAAALIVCLLITTLQVQGFAGYQKPPKAVLDLLNTPPFPEISISPAKDKILLRQPGSHPSIADLARPMLRLAGLRMNPRTNGPYRSQRIVALSLLRVSDGTAATIALPPNPDLGFPGGLRTSLNHDFWSADGKYVAFTNTTMDSIELWILDTMSEKAHKIPGITLNAAYGVPVKWLPDQRSLLIQIVPAGRGQAPMAAAVPTGPTIQESTGKKAPVRTFQDLLENAHDENLFEYYATSQLVLLDVLTEKWKPLGRPGIFQSAEPAPDGLHFLVARLHRPYSYLVTHENFPKEVEIWNRSGTLIHTLASLPLQEQVPNNGVPIGPREYCWRPTEPATLTWVEALDEGNPRAKVPHRDRILLQRYPFQGEPKEMARTQFRFTDLSWTERGGLALIEEFDRQSRLRRTWLTDADRPGESGRKVWERNDQDRYQHPGTPLLAPLPNGQRVLVQNGDSIFLAGMGASPEGDRPFLDEFNLKSFQSKRLYRCPQKTYETILGLLSSDGSRFLTRYESPNEAPNVLVRFRDSSEKRALTRFADPAPQLRQIRRQLVTYKRNDGVELSFTLYLPADYKEGQRLPTVLWAYPREYNDPGTASQVSGSPYRFLVIEGMSHLFFVTQGYAVLDNAAMPVVGDSETVNNTYIDQIVASAKAAIDKAVEMGVTDSERVGVGGHSYGAFMTANLLTHSGFFRAGIARSGAYNRTLTPFGFQQELRTIWEAPELYFKISPFLYAHKMNVPILLIHGEADNNSGTFPIQSERYYHALKGNGKTARYITLPLESHGYAARESIEHTLYEMLTWFEKHVKSASGHEKPATGGRAR